MAIKIEDIEKRINRLENVLWVVLVLAVAFGVSGATIWSKLQDAQAASAKLNDQLRKLENDLSAGLPALVANAQLQLDRHASKIASQITVLNGNLGIGTTAPKSRLHVAYGSGYIQIPHIGGAMPAPTDCDTDDEAGRMIMHDAEIAICPQGAKGWVRIN